MKHEDYKRRPIYTGDTLTAVRFVAGLVDFIGGGFHPDTPFAMYCESDGSAFAEPVPTFTPGQAAELDAELDAAMVDLAAAGIDVYEVALDALHAKIARENSVPPRGSRNCTYPYNADAWHRGFEAAYADLDADANPYTNYSFKESSNRKAWKDGHRQGTERRAKK